jgi:hypothetical protein
METRLHDNTRGSAESCNPPSRREKPRGNPPVVLPHGFPFFCVGHSAMPGFDVVRGLLACENVVHCHLLFSAIVDI